MRVFISVTRAATLMRLRRIVSNCASRQNDAFGAKPQGVQQPVGGGVDEQPKLVGSRLAARCAVGGEVQLVRLDQVLHLPTMMRLKPQLGIDRGRSL